MEVLCRFICDGFNVFRKEFEAEKKFSRFQEAVERAAPKMRRAKLPPNTISVTVRRLLNSQYFGAMSMACVCINICFLLSDHADKSNDYESIYNTQNDVFFGELVFEVVLVVIGYGVQALLTVNFRSGQFILKQKDANVLVIPE